MKKLGFGLMRLPALEGGGIDVEQVKQMVDLFLENGFTYFDTAYIYEGSEEAIRQALVERHPRDSYTLASKINCTVAATEEECKQQFYTSLERTGAGYFDYYLVHAVQLSNYQKYDEFHIWDFVKGLKEQGLIKNMGFSFHATPELLDELLTKHPEVDFVQLQINYADWENPDVQSRANYEVARKHGKPIVVMEPIKGGTLANPIPQVREVFEAANHDVSLASWCIRYVASHEGIMVVLSGMSNLEQMENNISYMKDFQPLTEEEYAVIDKAREALASVETIPCTKCHYCTPGCPMGIPIPEIFEHVNRRWVYNDARSKVRYERVIEGNGKASDCIQCGQCEAACPQQINIIERLQQAVEMFGQ
ncbi:MAG: aldo/keto reductase [Erysipelotrichaceae bacterium]|nr:aldo/keto reductase [Erysipelotrichaceae bacterium]